MKITVYCDRDEYGNPSGRMVVVRKVRAKDKTDKKDKDKKDKKDKKSKKSRATQIEASQAPAQLRPPVRQLACLPGWPWADEAREMLEFAASLVKPIMRARGWRIGGLGEFAPSDGTLYGYNINHGEEVHLRLRWSVNPRWQFLSMHNVVETLLHELCHNAYHGHDPEFSALYSQLRAEMDGLIDNGYRGEGFAHLERP
ncbi:hypothetical protein CDD83_2679 [Cordyceps sp. RAO-2017]|nr:hypothetical protein CDD83_2679 [Cordyceps sp. RAO-2017]